ncbi:MAG: hypothetical protein ABIN80_25370 [Dyadobacter sp.]|uniref:hypothetical protein n=1 Tax=Dyadobacter sp. TaxID=1914288 RepID=UPI0032645E56
MRPILVILFSLLTFVTSAQVTIVSKNNFNFVKGNYSAKSTNTELLGIAAQTIQPQTETASTDSNLAFLFPPNDGIVLFSSKNLTRENISGKLSAASLARIDTIFYNQAYRSETGSAFTFDIVYAYSINQKTYYTDFRPHDFVPFKYPLKDHNQLLVLAGQSTGYDMYADNGYPDHFHTIVFSYTGNSIRLFFESKKLPFHYEDEFWEEETSMKSSYHSSKKELCIEIKGKPRYKAVWNGRELKTPDL